MGRQDAGRVDRPCPLARPGRSDQRDILRLYLDAIHGAAALDRHDVHLQSAAEFGTAGIVTRLIDALDASLLER